MAVLQGLSLVFCLCDFLVVTRHGAPRLGSVSLSLSCDWASSLEDSLRRSLNELRFSAWSLVMAVFERDLGFLSLAACGSRC